MLAAKKELVIHIGLAKTGTSALQTYFAKNAGFMENKFSLTYPDLNRTQKLASSGKITSGNAHAVAAYLGAEGPLSSLSDNGKLQLQRVWEIFQTEKFDAVLLSSEFFSLVKPEKWMSLVEDCHREGVTLNIVCVVRDIIPWRVSGYGQTVKRKGSTRSLDDYLSDTDLGVISNVCELNKLKVKKNTFNLTVLNYDDIKHDIGRATLARLDRSNDLADVPATELGKVNRSLDDWEIRLMRAANSVLGETYSTYLSDALIYADPNRDTPPLSISDDVAKSLHSKFGDRIDYINTFITGSQMGMGALSQGETQSSITDKPAVSEAFQDVLERQTLLLLASFAKMQSDKSAVEAQRDKAMAEAQRDKATAEAQRDKAMAEAQRDKAMAELKKAWRDPIPHLFSAYGRKIAASKRKLFQNHK